MSTWKVAMPLDQGTLSQHFGRAEKFAFYAIDTGSKKTLSSMEKAPPPHDQGSIPHWLLQEGVTHLVAQHIGSGAQAILQAGGCALFAGAAGLEPAELAKRLVEGVLEADGCCGSCEGHGKGEERSHGEGHGEGGCGCSH